MEKAIVNEVFDLLPQKMVDLAYHAVKIQDRIAETTDEVEKATLKMELELLNNQIMKSASEAMPAGKQLA